MGKINSFLIRRNWTDVQITHRNIVHTALPKMYVLRRFCAISLSFFAFAGNKRRSNANITSSFSTVWKWRRGRFSTARFQPRFQPCTPGRSAKNENELQLLPTTRNRRLTRRTSKALKVRGPGEIGQTEEP